MISKKGMMQVSYTIAVIGSCVTDIILQVPHLPSSQEDINIRSQTMSLGGCAWNAAHMFSLFGLSYALCTPVGQGIYGDYVKAQLNKHQVTSFFPEAKEANGCCYCLIEENGERSFLADHGAEYHFQKEWFSLLDQEPIQTVYICGLEIEEESGQYIIDYLLRHPNLTIYFACGPRILSIPPHRMKQLFALHCILHLNQEEALSYTQKQTVEEAAQLLYQYTNQTVIITLGDKGCYLFENNQGHRIPTVPRKVVDTIGAGDAHIGSIIALRTLGKSMTEAIEIANYISGEVVSMQGSLLTQTQFDSCMHDLSQRI